MREKTAKAILANVKKTYSLIAEDFSKTRNKDWAEFKELSSYLKPSDKLLDIGCGNGRFYSFLSKKFPISYLGIDNSKNLLKEAKRLNKKAKFKKGNILNLPLKNNSFSIASCIAILHHIPSKKLREKALKEISRILKPRGRLLLTVWNLLPQEKYKKQVEKACRKWLYTLGKYEKRGLLIPWGNRKIARYYYAFKEKELEKLLSKYFKIIKKTVGKNLLYVCEKL